eukprot:RCo026668
MTKKGSQRGQQSTLCRPQIPRSPSHMGPAEGFGEDHGLHLLHLIEVGIQHEPGGPFARHQWRRWGFRPLCGFPKFVFQQLCRGGVREHIVREREGDQRLGLPHRRGKGSQALVGDLVVLQLQGGERGARRQNIRQVRAPRVGNHVVVEHDPLHPILKVAQKVRQNLASGVVVVSTAVVVTQPQGLHGEVTRLQPPAHPLQQTWLGVQGKAHPQPAAGRAGDLGVALYLALLKGVVVAHHHLHQPRHPFVGDGVAAQPEESEGGVGAEQLGECFAARVGDRTIAQTDRLHNRILAQAEHQRAHQVVVRDLRGDVLR